MATLTPTYSSSPIKGGDYHVQTSLNGGTASLQIKLLGADSYVDFPNNQLSDGELALFTLPTGHIRIDFTGNPVVVFNNLSE